MTQPEKTEEFVTRLTESQSALYGYVFSLVGEHSKAADVLQEANLVLWRKIDEFDIGKPFLPWAFAIARFQVLAHFRDQKRDRLLLDAELTQSLSLEAEQQASQLDLLQVALRTCLETLTTGNRELVERRYLRSMSITDIAAALDRTAGAVKVGLMRSRRHLAECIRVRVAAEGEP